MKPVSQRTASLLLMLAAFLWGGSVIAQKWGVTHFPPLRLALLRGVGATLCLLPFWWGRMIGGGRSNGGSFRSSSLLPSYR